MKKHITILLSCLAFFSNAQFQDNFTDGDFTSNPIWSGDASSFEINGSNQLHLNAPSVSDEATLVTPSISAVNGYWEFFVHLDLNPSTSNKALVYIISDQSDLENNLNGYYVKIGGASGTVDDVSLYKQTGSTNTKLIDGVDGTVALSPSVKVKVTRSLAGNFELFIDTSTALNNYISQGTFFDNEYMTSSYFGVLCDYTSSKSDKFYFDDFDITAQQYVDIFAPTLTSLTVLSANSLKISFSEDLNFPIAENINNYSVDNSIGNPSSASYNNVNNTVLLTFANNFQANTNYILSINNIEDLNSNVLDTTKSFSLNNDYIFESIIFNEILADETPSVGLPTFEFIEFKNLKNDTLYTEGWFLSDLTDTTYFNTDTILPYEYVLIGKTTAKTFYESFARTFGLTSFVSLNKSEDKLTLYNKYGNVIDSLHYYDDWFAGEQSPNGTDKVDGGWSLERKEDNFPCSAFLNWAPSTASIGGTPGQENTVFPLTGTLEPSISNAYFINDTTIQVVFDQEIINGTDENIYSVSYEYQGDMIIITNIIGVEKINLKTYNITIDRVYVEEGSYSLSVTGAGNCFDAIKSQDYFDIYYIKNPIKGDLIINEILFNPFTGAQDYIEIFNTTKTALNLKGFNIVEYDIDQEDTITDFSKKFETDFVMPPKSYFTFSEDTESVFTNYIVNKPEWLFDYNIPNFADKEGIAALVYQDSIVLDKLHYNSRWNFELLDSDNGVALERINSTAISQDNNNWASAAKSFGYGTPTAINSQSFPEVANSDIISISPEVFTPNQDGDNDFALISYAVDQAGFVATVTVFDIVGRNIKILANGETIGTEGFWKWDGTNYNNEKAKIGIYIVLVDLFDLKGNKKHFEEKVVLGTVF